MENVAEKQARIDKRNADMEAGWIYVNIDGEEIDLREWVHKDNVLWLENALREAKDKARQTTIPFSQGGTNG